jgi:transcription initiation factor TFIIE subunit alpha
LHPDDRELAFAQNTGAGQGDIIIDLQKDNEAARKAKISEADKKRQQNALPIWHQQSTVSGAYVADEPVVGAAVEVDHEDEDQFEEVGVEEIDSDRKDGKCHTGCIVIAGMSCI